MEDWTWSCFFKEIYFLENVISRFRFFFQTEKSKGKSLSIFFFLIKHFLFLMIFLNPKDILICESGFFSFLEKFIDYPLMHGKSELLRLSSRLLQKTQQGSLCCFCWIKDLSHQLLSSNDDGAISNMQFLEKSGLAWRKIQKKNIIKETKGKRGNCCVKTLQGVFQEKLNRPSCTLEI